MKKLAVMVCFASLFQIGQAQSDEKYQDLSITTSSFNNFGIMYRVGKENNMWRFQTAFMDVDYNVEDIYEKEENYIREYTTYTRSFNIALSAGKEWRKPLNDRINMRWGADLYINYTYDNEERFTPNKDSITNTYQSITNSISVGPRAVFGFDYSISNSFLFGLNLSPSIYYQWSNIKTNHEYMDFPEQNSEQKSTSKGIDWSFSNALLLSLTYKL